MDRCDSIGVEWTPVEFGEREADDEHDSPALQVCICQLRPARQIQSGSCPPGFSQPELHSMLWNGFCDTGCCSGA